MLMKLLDEYQNGNVNLKVYDVNGSKKYWLRVGQALLEFSPLELLQCQELLSAFVDEDTSEPDSEVLRLF